MDHDRPRKQFFSEPRMVQDLLQGFVDAEWVARVDFSTLERVPTSFVSEDYKKREQDVIWRMRLNDASWLYVYLLLEFQSRVDPFMALRVLVYLGLLYQDLVKQGRKGPAAGLLPDGRLPPVFPMVLHNGRPEWTAALDVAELIHPVPGLEVYRPSCRYLLLDESRCPTEAQMAARLPVAFAFELERADTRPALIAAIDRALRWPSTPELERLLNLVSRWITRVVIPARFPGQHFPELQTLGEVRSMLAERVEEWTHEWREQGRAEGRAEERAEILLRLARKRFGDLTAAQEDRLRAADADQVQDRLFSAQSFEELVGS